MDPEPGWRASRLTWYLILAALLSSCVLYRVVLALLPLPAGVTHPSALRTALYVGAAAALLMSIAWTRKALEPPASDPGGFPGPALPRFMAASVVAMALAEAAAALGFVLVASGAGSPAEYLAFGAGGFLVLALVILPRGLRYWSAWAAADGANAGGAAR